jgi:hypothetical protein
MTQTGIRIPDSTGRYVAGDDLRIEVTVADGDSNNDAKDLTGAAAQFVVAPSRGADPVLTKSTDGDITIVDADAGRLDIPINGSDTQGLGGGRSRTYHVELEVTDAAGNVATVLEGEWTIYQDTV